MKTKKNMKKWFVKNKSTILQWAFSAFIFCGVFVYGFSLASLFFLLSAVLLAPIPPVRKALKERNVGTTAIIVLSVVLFVVGSLVSSEQKQEEPSDSETREKITTSLTLESDEKTEERVSVESEKITEQRTEEKKTTETSSEEKKTSERVTEEKEETSGSLPPASQTHSAIPAYSGEIFVVLNDNIPSFSVEELTTTAYEKYSNLDSLGRCGVALASCGKEIMPADGEKRGSISHIYPSGWVQAKYDGISGGYLYNRCHLLGWQLSAENDNKKNLITGTRSFNVDGMLPFENMIADYIKETGNHVAYRVTPVYDGNNLVAKGVRMEAYSVEDRGDGICFHIFVYNVQEGITIDYATGNSSKTSVPTVNTPPTTTAAPTTTSKAPVTTAPPTTTAPIVTTFPVQTATYVLNTNTKKIHKPSCRHVSSIKDVNRQSFSGDLSSLYAQGYENCKTCF